jgi:hypothetical protein
MGQMTWLHTKSDSTLKILHLQVGNSGWKPYTSFPEYSVADYPDNIIHNGSKGWATYQKLRADNWELVATPTNLKAILLSFLQTWLSPVLRALSMRRGR